MKAVTAEVNKLFKTNIKGSLLTSDAFKHWCHLQNMPEYKKAADVSAAKVTKVLGLSPANTKDLSAAMVLMMSGDKPKAKSMLDSIAAKEKKKDLANAIEASLKSAGLM
jgi:hypothetical protein